MGISIKPVFNRLNLINKSGKYSIHYRITIDRKTKYFNPRFPKVEKEYWSGKPNKWIKETHPLNFEMNSLIQQKLAAFDKHIIRLNLWDKPINFRSVEEFFHKKGDNTYFNDFVKEYIKNIKGLEANTKKVYYTFERHINEFNNQIRCSDINEDLLLAFKEFLQTKKELKGAATKKYFDKFKVICKEAVKKGYLEINPFLTASIKIKVEKPSRTFLEIDEIIALKKLSFTKNQYHLERTRDYFLFQLYSGLYYSDLKKLDKDMLFKNELGYYILDKRSKNAQRFIIPIYKFPNATKIIKKYENKHHQMVFPDIISDQKYNQQLKTIGDLAKIKKNLTNKVGRHTYVQLWMGQGVERQFVSKMVGHTQEKTTQEYYDMSIYNIHSKVEKIDFETIGI